MQPSQPTTDATFASLKRHKHLRLTTFRRNGAPVGSAVWFAEDPADGSLFVKTLEGAGKLKRINHTHAVELAASNARGAPIGPTVKGVIEVLDDPALQRQAAAALQARYGLMGRAAGFVVSLRGGRWVYLRIRPAAADGTPG